MSRAGFLDYGEEGGDGYSGTGHAEPLDAEAIVKAKEAEALARMHNLPLEAVLAAGREAVLRHLVAKAQVGSITAAESGVLRNILRDNGLVLAAPNLGGPKPSQSKEPDLPEYSEWEG